MIKSDLKFIDFSFKLLFDSQLGLVALNRFQSFRISLVSMIKSDLKFIDFSFKLLFDSQRFSLSTLLSLKRSSQRVHSTGMVLPRVVELLLLLSHTPVNFLPDLSKLQLGPQHLVFFLLQGSLSLLKCSQRRRLEQELEEL